MAALSLGLSSVDKPFEPKLSFNFKLKDKKNAVTDINTAFNLIKESGINVAEIVGADY